MPQIKNKKNIAMYTPAVTFHKAKTSYFLHNNQACSVADAPTETFKAAVLALAPRWATSELYGPLIANPEDLADRWFLLCGLCEAKRPMKLYDAEQAVGVVVAAGDR